MKNIIKKLVGHKNAKRLFNYKIALGAYFCRAHRFIFNHQNYISMPTARIFSHPHYHVFFGYYDITPFSANENLLLAMNVPFEKKLLVSNTKTKVGFYNLSEEKPSFHEIGSTRTWCWQQGCRLQWYPEENNKTAIYNTLVNGNYGCVVKDIFTKETMRKYKVPIYTVSRDGRWGLSLNFSRLQRLRPGYGYNTVPDRTQNELMPKNDGILRLDMATGEEKFLFSIRDILNIRTTDTMPKAEHYFNHLLFNPESSRFLLVHLWVNKGKRYSRLITSDRDGKNIYVMNNEGHSSHYCWKSNTQLLIYTTYAKTGTHYYLCEDMSDNREIVGEGILTQDGHPSFFPYSNIIITDTYPDKYRDQSLIIYNIDNCETKILSKFYIPIKFYGETRCDLHPRLSPDGAYVCVDNVQNNLRCMAVIDTGF